MAFILPDDISPEEAMKIGLEDERGTPTANEGDARGSNGNGSQSGGRGRSGSRDRANGRRSRSRSTSREGLPRDRSDSEESVDEFGRIKPKDRGDRDRRSRSRSASAERRRLEEEAVEAAKAKAQAIREEAEAERRREMEEKQRLASLEANDPRETKKYVAVDVGGASAAIPPPPRRRRGRGAQAGGAGGQPSGLKGRQTSDAGEDVSFETPEEREQREIEERRAKRRCILQSYAGQAGAGGGEPATSAQATTEGAPVSGGGGAEQPMDGAPPPPRQAEEQEAEMWQVPAEVPGESEEQRDKRLKAALLLRFQMEARRKQERRMAGEGPADQLPGDVLQDEEEGEEEDSAAANNFLDKRSKEEEEALEAKRQKGKNGGAAPALDMFAEDEPGQQQQGSDQPATGGHGRPGKEGGRVKKLVPHAGAAGLQEVAVAADHKDEEGYFQHRVGERMHNNRYRVLSCKGRGVFSSVLLAQDELSNRQVAIKVLRGIDIMGQAGRKELDILKALTAKDTKDEGHVIRVLDDFRLGGGQHVCIVMEAMEHSLRRVLKTHGKGKGIHYRAVLSFTRQVMQGLSFLHAQGIVHADLKPDNIVISKDARTLKICDLGSAFRVSELEDLGDMPYLQSRFYRAPEVILGYKPRGCAMDVWSAAASMFELYTDTVLFTGRNNNELLKNVMSMRGPFPKKLLKHASMRGQHFDPSSMAFISRDVDPVTKQEQRRVMTNIHITRTFGDALFPAKVRQQASKEEVLGVEFLRDMLDRCLTLDPSKRLKAQEAVRMFQAAAGATAGGGGAAASSSKAPAKGGAPRR